MHLGYGLKGGLLSRYDLEFEMKMKKVETLTAEVGLKSCITHN